MSAEPIPPERPDDPPPGLNPFVRFRRLALMGIGWVLVIAGFPIALLPIVHALGIALVVIGLILILRSSFGARRQFVAMQKRHPGFLFPVRRLLRREPEILPVAWQQLLRTERLFLKHLRWQFLRKLRRRFRRRPSTGRLA
jgi:hypothetical protein